LGARPNSCPSYSIDFVKAIPAPIVGALDWAWVWRSYAVWSSCAAAPYGSKAKARDGSSFSVILPTMISPSASDKVRADPTIEDIQSAEIGPSLQHLRVLVVDDEEGAREIASAILTQAQAEVLTQAQAEVRTAASASEALEVLDEWQPDVLVADLGMPEVDGYQLIRQVRARGPQRGGDVPAAALTAYARTQDRMRVLSAGFQIHIPKPIQPAELITVVASLAKRMG
jgi:CheY-like chemotaxis protein